jgi:hypothetical protein
MTVTDGATDNDLNGWEMDNNASVVANPINANVESVKLISSSYNPPLCVDA